MRIAVRTECRNAKVLNGAAPARNDIPDGASVFMNIGTSTEAVARQMLNHKDLMVVTNNTNVANILVENPDCEIVVAGGVLRRSDGGLVGNLDRLDHPNSSSSTMR